MELTIEVLLERRRSLEADNIALSGAIQQVDWCIAKLEEVDGERYRGDREVPASSSETVTPDGSNTDMEVENGDST